jgi:hypothetical protein
MATSALMAIRINDSLGLRRKLTRVMFCSVVAGKKHFMFFSRQKSPRCSLGGRWSPQILGFFRGKPIFQIFVLSSQTETPYAQNN